MMKLFSNWTMMVDYDHIELALAKRRKKTCKRENEPSKLLEYSL